MIYTYIHTYITLHYITLHYIHTYIHIIYILYTYYIIYILHVYIYIYIHIIYTYGCDFVRVQLHVDALSSFFHGPRCKILIIIDGKLKAAQN